MSELCIYQVEDIVQNDFLWSDDIMEMHPFSQQPDVHSIASSSLKKHRRQESNYFRSHGDICADEDVDHEVEKRGHISMSKRRNIMLEKDSWSHPQKDAFPSSADFNTIKREAALSSNNFASSSHAFERDTADEFCANERILDDDANAVDNDSFNYSLDNIADPLDDLEFFKNTEDKDSSDFLYYGLLEIENFEDVDRMFRSCDSTFGVQACKEDVLDWCPTFCSNDEAGVMGKSGSRSDLFTNRDSSCISEKSNSLISVMDGPVTQGSIDRLPNEQSFPSCWNQEEDPSGPTSCTYFQSSQSVAGSDKSHLMDASEMGPKKSAVLFGNNDLNRPSPIDSSLASNDHDLPCQHSNLSTDKKRGSLTFKGTKGDLGLSGKQILYSGIKYKSQPDKLGACNASLLELGSSSNTKEKVNDISLEAASFHQLQTVMEKLDVRTKLCIRDSLYRLARSAEQRHIHEKLNSHLGEDIDTSASFLPEGANSFITIETDTNPIDRSVAHLLFHRPSESASPNPGSGGTLPSKSPCLVHEYVKQEAASESDKVSDS